MISFDDLLSQKSSVAAIGPGYVGLPLAVALARHFSVIGFDINAARVEALNDGMASMWPKRASSAVSVPTNTSKGRARACRALPLRKMCLTSVIPGWWTSSQN